MKKGKAQKETVHNTLHWTMLMVSWYNLCHALKVLIPNYLFAAMWDLFYVLIYLFYELFWPSVFNYTN